MVCPIPWGDHNERAAASWTGGLGGATLRGLGITTGVGLLMIIEDCGFLRMLR